MKAARYCSLLFNKVEKVQDQRVDKDDGMFGSCGTV
jgi:hypothetical protein